MRIWGHEPRATAVDAGQGGSQCRVKGLVGPQVLRLHHHPHTLFQPELRVQRRRAPGGHRRKAPHGGGGRPTGNRTHRGPHRGRRAPTTGGPAPVGTWRLRGQWRRWRRLRRRGRRRRRRWRAGYKSHVPGGQQRGDERKGGRHHRRERDFHHRLLGPPGRRRRSRHRGRHREPGRHV